MKNEDSILPMQARWARYLFARNFKLTPIYGICPDGNCLCGKQDCTAPGKHPMKKGWQVDGIFQSDDEIHKFWMDCPRANYGILADGLVIIDIDGPEGEDSYQKHLKKHLEGLITLKVSTGKGRHEYYKSDGRVKNSVKSIPGIDIRSTCGGYVLGPGSLHKTQKTYDVLCHDCFQNDQVVIAALPPEIEEILTKSRFSPISDKELRKAQIKLGAQISEGGRNEVLASYVGTILRKGLSDDQIHTLAKDFNEKRFNPPLSLSEVASVVKSISNYRRADEEPRELSSPIQPALPYPTAALGEILAPAVKAIHDVLKAPEALIANSVLAAASLAVQGHANISIDGRSHPVSLFLITIGASGERKSAVDKEVLRILREYEKEQGVSYASERRLYEQKKEIYESEKKRILSSKGNKDEKEQKIVDLGLEPQAPYAPLMLVEEPTYEGLVKLLERGRPSIGLFSDEGARLIGGHAMSSENLLKTISGLSSLWDGSPITRVRSGDGAIKLYGRRLALHLMVQPGVAQQLIGNSVVEDQGLLARCLIVYPETTAGKRRYNTSSISDNYEMKVFEAKLREILLRPLPLVADSNELRPRELPLSGDARGLWINFYDEIESQLGEIGEYEPIRAFASKAAEQTLRIAGVLSLLEDLDSKAISERHLGAAITLMRFYLKETLRLAGNAANPELILAQKLLTWSQRYSEVSYTKIAQYGPGSVRTADKEKLINILVSHGWFKEIKKHTWTVVNTSPQGPVATATSATSIDSSSRGGFL